MASPLLRFLGATLAFSGLFVTSAFGQSGPNVVGLEIIRARLDQSEREARIRALRWAEATGSPTFADNDENRFQLVGFFNRPRYLATTNATAADTISTDEVYPGAPSGLNLTGAGIRLGVWDQARVQVAHPEFGGRAIQKDSPSSTSGHATHVGGTMVAAGVDPLARGMAYQAGLDAYDWNSDLSEMADAGGAGLPLSNHSYAIIAGWISNYFGDGKWAWFGNTAISQTEDYTFGFYDSLSRDLDDIIYNANTYLPVIAAANDRLSGPSTQPVSHWVYDNATSSWVLSSTVRSKDGDANGFDSLPPGYQIAKNTMVVGAVNDIIGGWTSATGVTAAGFSSRGPTDDGRIKPDIASNGVGLYSTIPTNGYGTSSGTSMAAPTVTGSLGLVVRHFQNLFGGLPRSATTKAIAIHTADEAGNAGPDYTFGWGLLNTLRASQLVSSAFLRRDQIFENQLANGGTWTRTIVSDGTTPLRVSMAWADPAGTPAPDSLDPANPMLVNDLDLRLVGPSGTTLPFKLDRLNPTTAATRGDNTVDNVEQCYIAAPPAGTYTVQVTHKGALAASQAYTVIVTGQTAPKLGGFGVNPTRSAWNSGVVVTGTVTLDSAAPRGGATVTLTSNNSAATVPANVVIPEGQTSGVFNITLNSVATATTVTLGASYGTTTLNTPLVVSPTGNEAVFVSQTVPTTLNSGQISAVTVRMRNVGTTTWAGGSSGGYGLRSQSPDGNTTWGLSTYWLPSSAAPTPPGATRDFTFNITAPTTPGTYTFQWRMRQAGPGNFGEMSVPVSISVGSSPNDAQFISQTVPNVMTHGNVYSVTVTMKNTGSATWTGGGVNGYGLRSQNPDGNTTWGLNTKWLGSAESIAPGASKTFTFNVTAPLIPGTYNFQWRMRQAGVGNFGQTTTNVPVTVN